MHELTSGDLNARLCLLHLRPCRIGCRSCCIGGSNCCVVLLLRDLVLRDDPGMTVAGTWDGVAMHGNGSAPMALAGVGLSDERRLTERGKGLDTMLGAVLPMFQVGLAAIAVGIAEAARAGHEPAGASRADAQ